MRGVPMVGRPGLFVLHGELAPKKTSPVLRRSGRRCPVCKQPTGPTTVGHPKKREKSWDQAILQARALWSGKPIDEPVTIRVRYFRRRLDADPTNLDSALADVLQAAGVVANDKQVCTWPDHPRRDVTNPRTEFWFVDPDQAAAVGRPGSAA